MPESPCVSVIIPTTAERRRAQVLERAIDSVVAHQELPGVAIVVVNGDRYDAEVNESLKRRHDIRYFYLQGGGLTGAARRFGRAKVGTEFFCFLDDDDFYFPCALRERVDAMRRDTNADVIITQGLKEIGGETETFPSRGTFDPADPLRSLMAENWLPSCGGIFRSSSVPGSFFDSELHYLEWTFIAFRLALEKRIRFLDSGHSHFRISDTPASASKSTEYATGTSAVLLRMLAYDVPGDVRRTIERKLTANLHVRAEQCLASGRAVEACRAHIRCLRGTGGLRYLPFTRKMILPLIRGILS